MLVNRFAQPIDETTTAVDGFASIDEMALRLREMLARLKTQIPNQPKTTQRKQLPTDTPINSIEVSQQLTEISRAILADYYDRQEKHQYLSALILLLEKKLSALTEDAARTKVENALISEEGMEKLTEVIKGSLNSQLTELTNNLCYHMDQQNKILVRHQTSQLAEFERKISELSRQFAIFSGNFAVRKQFSSRNVRDQNLAYSQVSAGQPRSPKAANSSNNNAELADIAQKTSFSTREEQPINATRPAAHHFEAGYFAPISETQWRGAEQGSNGKNNVTKDNALYAQQQRAAVKGESADKSGYNAQYSRQNLSPSLAMKSTDSRDEKAARQLCFSALHRLFSNKIASNKIASNLAPHTAFRQFDASVAAQLVEQARIHNLRQKN